MKFYYRIYKTPKIKRLESKSKLDLKPEQPQHQQQQQQMKQPTFKFSTNLKEALVTNNSLKRVENKFFLSKNETKTATFSSSPPRNDLKMIITKKPSQAVKTDELDARISKEDKKEKSKASHSIGKDFKRLRSIDVKYSEYSSASGSSSKSSSPSSWYSLDATKTIETSKKNVTGTVPHDDDLKQFNNNSNAKKISNDTVDEYTIFDPRKKNEEKERHTNKTKRENSPTKQQKNMTEEKNGRETATNYNNNSSSYSNNNQLNVPKLKIELPSLKTKITVSKQGTDKYTISPQPPHSAPVKSPSTHKKVRFSFSEDYSRASSNGKSPHRSSRSYDFQEYEEYESPRVDLHEYISKIGLKPVAKDSEVVGHRKRKKSKHSKDNDSKKRRLHAEVSSVDESLKLKLKVYKQGSTVSTTPIEEKKTVDLNKEKQKERSKEASATITKENVENDEQNKKNQTAAAENNSSKVETIDLCDSNSAQASDDLKTSENGLKIEISNTDTKVEILSPKKEEIAPTTVQQEILKPQLQPMVCIPNLNLKQSTYVNSKIGPDPITKTSNSNCNNSSNKPVTTVSAINSAIIKPPEPIARKPITPKQVTSTGSQTLTSYVRTQTAKMGSPSTTRIGTPQRPFITNINPSVRPQSYPPMLGLLPISSLKRSTSLENNNNNNNATINKQPRLDQVEINAQNKFIGKITQPPNNIPLKQYPPKVKLAEAVQRSPPPMSSFSNIAKANDFYKKFNESVSLPPKKPVPNLLSTASISVTKMSDMMPPPISSTTEENNRPAVEILRIPSSVPVVDRKHIESPIQNESSKLRQMKNTRPIPPTIPLAKIKKSGLDMEHFLKMKEMMFHSTYGDLPKLVNYATSTTTSPKPKEVQKALDIPSLQLIDQYKQLDDINVRASPLQDKISPFITNESSGFNTDFSKPSLPPIESIDQISSDPDFVKIHQQLSKDIALLNFKLNQDNQSLNDSEKINSYTNLLSGLQTLNHQLQQVSKKNEKKMPPPNQPISTSNTHANNIGRQQSLSVRNVPNPSALMFRNQQPQPQKNTSSDKSVEKEATPPIKLTDNSILFPPSVTSSVFSTKPGNKIPEQNSDIEELLTKTTIISKNSLNTLTSASTTTKPKESQAQSQAVALMKNMHLEKLAASLLAAAANKSVSTKVDEEKTNSEPTTNKNDLKKGNAENENDNNNNEDSNNNKKTVATTNSTTNGDMNGKKQQTEEISNDTKKAEFIDKHVDDSEKKLNNNITNLNNNSEIMSVADS